MHIIIETKAFYDWMRHPHPEKITDADKMGKMVKQNHEGTWLLKSEISRPSTTTVVLPETEVQECLAHFKRKNEFFPENREEVVAWYLATKTMPEHAHPKNFTKISVPEEPEVEKYLNQFFKVAK